MTTHKPEPLLWLSDARGQYIPRDFATSFAARDKDVSGVSAEDWAILEAGPEHEFYWDAWTEVCDRAKVRDDKNNVTYHVHQDGDCWLVPDGMEWSEDQMTNRKMRDMAQSPILTIMIHAVTHYDRRRAKRPGYNEYASAQYMTAVDRAYELYNSGATLDRAIGENFNDRLRDAVLKAVHAAGY